MNTKDTSGNQEQENIPYREWYTLKEACDLKGLNVKTAYNNRNLMPNKGIYEGEIGGRKCFKREQLWRG
jgi:hypothetical protein